MVSSLGHTKFVNALKSLDEEGALENSILISAASLRILGVRVYTHFIDLLVPESYYNKKAEENKFTFKYELEPIPLEIASFRVRLGTVKGDLCSFRHLVKPYNIYEEVEFKIGNKVRTVKIRPVEYVRKDSEEAIEKLIQGSNEKYWQDLYSYHKQIEAIDMGVDRKSLKFGPQKTLKLQE